MSKEVLLEDSCFVESKLISTPFDPNIKLHHNSTDPYSYIPAYRRLIGRLLHLNAIIPNITLCTQQLSQFMSTPIVTHFNAACRILNYLKSCPGRGIMFPRDSNIQLNGYSNAIWARFLDTRRSISG